MGFSSVGKVVQLLGSRLQPRMAWCLVLVMMFVCIKRDGLFSLEKLGSFALEGSFSSEILVFSSEILEFSSGGEA